MDTDPFAGKIIGGLEDACYPRERNTHERTAFAISTQRSYTAPKWSWDNWNSAEEEELLSVLSELTSESPLTQFHGSFPTEIKGYRFAF
jgi:hypothetical protein